MRYVNEKFPDNMWYIKQDHDVSQIQAELATRPKMTVQNIKNWFAKWAHVHTRITTILKYLLLHTYIRELLRWIST